MFTRSRFTHPLRTIGAPASAGRDLALASLPTDVTETGAVEIAYGPDLYWIEMRLRGKSSVMVECDKGLTLHLFKNVRQRLKGSLRFVVIDARPQPRQSGLTSNIPSAAAILGPDRPAPEPGPAGGPELEMPRSVIGQTIANLQQAVLNYQGDTILMMPHLDLIASSVESGLTMEAREVLSILYDNPSVRLLGFRDPSFHMPKALEALFPFHRSVVGIPRLALPQLVTQTEARKFNVQAFDAYALYKYVSGLNAVRLRALMSQVALQSDADPLRPQIARANLQLLRNSTITGGFELPNIRLDQDIAGYQPVKQRLRAEVIDLVRSTDKAQTPDQIKAIEDLIPRGIIFEGPPGTGKTLFAKAMATELNATVTVVSGPEIKSKWYGQTEENLRRIFADARRNAPSVIVFDEIDAIAPSRSGAGATHDVTHSTVNQLLTEMDGFRKDELVFVVGTTNFVRSLDPALLRPGRFELKILVDYPHDLDRRDIIQLYRTKLSLNMSDDMVQQLVLRTRGYADRQAGLRFSGDHLFAVMKALKREVLRHGGAEAAITTGMLDAVLREMSGVRPEPPSPAELDIIAVHEAGHTVLHELLPDHPPVEEVTLEGEDSDDLSTFFTRVMDQGTTYVHTERQLRDVVCGQLGGMVAEEMIFGTHSGGASHDLDTASNLARNMTARLGMGPTRPGGRRMLRSMDPDKAYGRAADDLDSAVDQILNEELDRAQKLLGANHELVIKVADALLARKTLTRADLNELMPGVATEKAQAFEQGRRRLPTRKTPPALPAPVESAPPTTPPAAPKSRSKRGS